MSTSDLGEKGCQTGFFRKSDCEHNDVNCVFRESCCEHNVFRHFCRFVDVGEFSEFANRYILRHNC